MKINFESAFAERLAGFIEQKHALGYLYNDISSFKIFDRMCAKQFPDEYMLTADICHALVTRRGNESAKTTARRMPFIREFARYLIRNGEQAYILPSETIKKCQRYIPHIYSRADLVKLWRA